jgi:hypothetical protein
MEVILGTNTDWILKQMAPKPQQGSKFIHAQPKPKNNK